MPASNGQVQELLDRVVVPAQRGSDSAAASPSGVQTGERPPRPLEGLRVQLISLSYAPDTTGIAPYAASYAEMMRNNGATVTVDAGVPHYPAWKVPAEYRWWRSGIELHDGILIRRHRHAVPRRHGLVGRARYEVSFLCSLLVTRPVPTDVVIAVTPALAGAVAGAMFARRANAPLGVIVQDLVGHAAGQAGVPGGSRISAKLARLEARVLSQAQAIGVIAPAIKLALEAEGLASARFTDLRNHTHIASSIRSREETRLQLGWPLDRPIVLHSGNMGAKQDLLSVVTAAQTAQARGDRTYFVLMGNGNQRRSLQAALNVDNLRIQDPVDEAYFPDALAAADLLLVNERPTVLDMSLPSKLTSYFSSGRPVVARVNSAGATAREVERSGGGVVVHDTSAESLLAAIDRLLRHPDRSSMGTSAQTYVQDVLGVAAAEGRLIDFVTGLRAEA